MSLEPARITINFHPDRPAAGEESVLDAILRTGRIQNQYKTATTNGFALGEKNDVRRSRESALFGGAYDDAAPNHRPRYGAVDLFANGRGGWPRFGSSHWVLNDAVLEYSTVTIPGSHSSSAWWGTWPELVGLMDRLSATTEATQYRHRFHLIDGAAEVQVHAELHLNSDVTALVLDPSFQGTRIEGIAARICDAYAISLEWTPELQSKGLDWQLRSARPHARQRVLSARAAGDVITAAWIGGDVWASRSDRAARSAADRASRYLWNRLLLTQHARADLAANRAG